MTRAGFLLCLTAFLPAPLWASVPPLPVGSPAPMITLEGIFQAPDLEPPDWQALNGKLVVLEFWATWCAPCVTQIPFVNRLIERLADEPVVFLFVTDEDEITVRSFLAERPLNAWIGLDTDQSMSVEYRVPGVPYTVLVSPEGRVLSAVAGGKLSEPQLRKELARWRQRPPNPPLRWP